MLSFCFTFYNNLYVCLVLGTFLQLLCDTVLIGCLSVRLNVICTRDISTTSV